MKLFTKLFAGAFLSVVLIASCKKDKVEDVVVTPVTLAKEYSVKVSAANEIPANTRTENGTGSLKIFSDNSISFNIVLSNFAVTDTIKAAHIHLGNPVNNGGVVVGFVITSTAGTMEGKATNVRQTLVDSLKNNTAEFYVNIHTAQFPGGLARGQVGKNILQAYNVALSGLNETTPVITTATGTAFIRINEDNKLISRIAITGLEAADTLRFAHIHIGATGTNGPVITNLADTKLNFETTEIRTISAGLADSIATRLVYVNVHSNFSPSGKLRGQIR